jgi:hypothetical protein
LQSAIAIALAVASCCSLSAADLVDLRPPTEAGGYRQVRVIVEVEGKLKLNADGQEVKHLPIKAQAELNYVERVLSQTKQWSDLRLIRSYQSAEAKLRLRDAEIENRLRDDRRIIVVQSDSKRAVQFSPLGPLKREELELLEAPASGIAPEALLPPRVVKVEGQWQLADETVARLLGLEAISQQSLVCTLSSVKEGLAVVGIEGKVAGAAAGVSSDIELKAKLNFDVRKRAVTWLTMACKENRAIGHAQPGFEVVTTLRMVTAPAKAVTELSDKSLAALPLKAESGQLLLDLTSESAGFQLHHDRRWQAMVEQHDVTILRLIDRGDLIAQCNLSPLPSQSKEEQLTLEAFQDDVKRTLGKSFGQIAEASEETTSGGIRLMRVVVSGSAGELPIQWMYYHLADEHGHRAALVFTIEATLVERFAQIDRELVTGFHFLADKQPTPAEN